MAGFDIDAALRWARFDPRRPLARRPDTALPIATAADVAGSALLIDTCVYIHQLQGRLPKLIELLIDVRQINHSSVAVQELLHTIGVLDPDDPRTAAVVGGVRTLIKAMPDHRLFTPDADVLGRAALLAGILSRLQGYGRPERLRALQDATLFCQAHKLGLTVLTANLGDFDYLQQLVPAGRVLFYRAG